MEVILKKEFWPRNKKNEKTLNWDGGWLGKMKLMFRTDCSMDDKLEEL